MAELSSRRQACVTVERCLSRLYRRIWSVCGHTLWCLQEGALLFGKSGQQGPSCGERIRSRELCCGGAFLSPQFNPGSGFSEAWVRELKDGQ